MSMILSQIGWIFVAIVSGAALLLLLGAAGECFTRNRRMSKMAEECKRAGSNSGGESK